MSKSTDAGTSIGSASTLSSVSTCVEDAALLRTDGLTGHVERHGGVDRLVEADFLQVDVRDGAAHLVELVLLEHRRVGVPAVDDDVEHGVQAARAGQRRAQVALGDRDRDRRVLSVENAGNQPLPAQAARLGGAEDRPVLDHELDALSCHGAGL